jgi:RecJ OB domain
MAEKWPLVQSGQLLDIAFTLDVNEWNGERSLQLKILDVRENSGIREFGNSGIREYKLENTDDLFKNWI